MAISVATKNRSRQNGVYTQRRYPNRTALEHSTNMVTITKRLLAVAMVLGFGMALSACETAEGFGRDMEKLGQQIQESVNE